MKLGSKYYRNNLNTLAILSVGCVGIFWDKLHGRGHPEDEPGAFILIAVIMVVGNVGLFIAMRRSKRREHAELFQTRISDATHAVTNTKQQPTPEEAAQKRKGMRRFMSFWCIGGGLLFAIFGREWLVNALPVHWVGYLLILLGILGLGGVNVFYGGPLDLRLDTPEPPPHHPAERK
jgi:hypothetical protein